jgi:hypothetical protein
MTGTDQINQGRKQALEGSAASAGALATPAFGYAGIAPSTHSALMTQLMGQRAQGASTAPAYGAGAVNQASSQEQAAYGTAAKAVPDPNTGLNSMASVLKDVQTAAGPGGALSNLSNAFGTTKDLTNKNPPATGVYTGPALSYDQNYDIMKRLPGIA